MAEFKNGIENMSSEQCSARKENPSTAYSLSLIIPAYNEEKSLEEAVILTIQTLNHLNMLFEIIIVNDGSHDHTQEIIQKLAQRFTNIAYGQHAQNQGIGAAFRTGVKKATMDYVLLLPVDNPFLPEDLTPYLDCLGKFDIIVGCRQERVGYSDGLKFLSYVYNRVLIPRLFALPVTDVNWIHAYRRKIFAEGNITIEYSGPFFFAEVLTKAHRKGLTMTEVPVHMKRRVHGRPTISRLPVILKIFRDMLTFFIKINF